MSNASTYINMDAYFQFCEDLIKEINKLNKEELTVETSLDHNKHTIWYRFSTESVTQEHSLIISTRMGNNIYPKSDNFKDKYKRAILCEVKRRYKEFKSTLVIKTIEKDISDFLK